MGLRRILKTIATMKNLFKKMMLVAVAAMAFVACSQDNDEINATVKKTDVVFNLSIEDVTRAYFGEEQGSGSDTSFPSYWSGNESVRLVAYDSSDAVVAKAWGSIEAEGEQATQGRVRATFEGELAGVEKVRAYVGSWSYNEPGVLELAQEQYMDKEGTVASNAHTMSAEAEWDGVAPSIDLNFKHAVAYGRMQIKSIVGIDDVNDVTITKAIVKVDEAEYQVSLNSDFDTKYIWFACEADEDIKTLDIEVKASNGSSYVKTIDMTAAANPLKFRTGEVSKFAVSGLEKVEEVPTADYTATNIVWNNKEERFELTGPDITNFWIKMNAADRPGNNSFAVGEYTGVSSRTTPEKQFSIYQKVGGNYAISWTDTSSASTMSIKVKNGEYLIYINYVALWNQGGFTLVYKGLPAGFVLPGESGGDEPEQPVALETPVVSSSVNGNEVVVSWSAINGAANYTVTLGSQSQTVDSTSVTFSDLEYSTTYAVSVVANPADTTANIASEAGTASFTTEAEPEQNAVLELVSASATHSASNMIGGTGYDLTFTDANGNTIFYRVQTKDHTYLRVGEWNATLNWATEGFVDAVSWPGVGYPWPYSMTVAVVDGEYDITLQTADLDNGNKAYTAHYKGQIEGFTLPVVEEEEIIPEFVIPGEGGSYTYDFTYTTLVAPLSDVNDIRVAQDNGWIWDIKFNPGLSSIVPGDYTAVQSFTTADALEVDTFNGSVQYGNGYQYFYPDSFSEVSINVQQEGEFYCITLIGANGYSAEGKTYRLVYIGKIK